MKTKMLNLVPALSLGAIGRHVEVVSPSKMKYTPTVQPFTPSGGESRRRAKQYGHGRRGRSMRWKRKSGMYAVTYSHTRRCWELTRRQYRVAHGRPIFVRGKDGELDTLPIGGE